MLSKVDCFFIGVLMILSPLVWADDAAKNFKQVKEINLPNDYVIKTKLMTKIVLDENQNTAPILLSVVDLIGLNKASKNEFKSCEITGYAFSNNIAKSSLIEIITGSLRCTENGEIEYFKLSGHIKVPSNGIGFNGNGKVSEDLEGKKTITVDGGVALYVVLGD